MSVGRTALIVAFVLGCSRALRPAPAVDAEGDLLAMARARPCANRVVGRFALDLRAGSERGSTGGAVVLDRPGRGHLAVLGPLGGPLATLQTDGVGVAIALSRGHEHYVGRDADGVLRDATGGAVGVDDLFGLFVGDPPLDDATPLSRREIPGGLEVVLPGPRDSRVTLDVRGDGTPSRLVAVDARGEVQLDASWEPFALLDPAAPPGPGSILVPTAFELHAPPLGVDATVKMKSWAVPEAAPDVFGLAPPEGFRSEPLEDLAGRWGPAAGLLGLGVEPPSE